MRSARNLSTRDLSIRDRSGRNRRSGYVMVLLAMLLFGLLAMAALVIDLGFARLAQRQMQSAADAAALEGLRGEGLVDVSYGDRQDDAEALIGWTFDDNLDPADGDDGPAEGGEAFGAGPIVSFAGGSGDSDLNASELLTVNVPNRVYKPTVLTGAGSPGQFQVELQRGASNVEADLYSHGPSVPFLFARGSLIGREFIGNGISVGAKSTAQPRQAVRVGPPIGAIPGVVAVAYARANWGASPTNPVTVSSNLSSGLSIGEIISVGETATPPVSGYCVIFDQGTSRVIGFGLLGQPVPPEGVVARQNATAHLGAARDALIALASTELQAVIAANRTLEHALTAPVLVRN